MTVRFSCSIFRATALALLITGQARAAVELDEEEGADAAAEETPAEDGFQDEGEEDDGLDDPEATEGAPADEGDAKAAEEEKPPSILIGARYRIAVVPQFLINMFGVEGGRTTWIHGGGPEVAFSQKDFEIILSPWIAGYSMEETPFKGPNDPENAWELVESHLSMFYLTADFLWKTHISKQVDFHIGAGAGIGIVFGNLYRNEAYWASAPGVPAAIPPNGDPYNTLPSPTNPALQRCGGVNVPAGTNGLGECMPGGNYNSGAPWPVYPWLTFQTGLRYSPVRNFIGRLDLGIGATGFWFGLGADYGL